MSALPDVACEPSRETCSSIYSSTGSTGRPQVRRLAGEEGMNAFGAVSNDPLERASFQCRMITARYGRIDIGVIRFTPHSRMLPADNFGHNHPVSRLVILLDGAQTYSTGDREWRLTPGAGLLVPGDASASYRVKTVTTRVHIDLAADDPGLGPLLQNVRWGYWPERSPALAAMSAFVQTLLQQGGPGASRTDWAEVQGTLEALVCATISSAPPAEGFALCHRELAMQYIRTHHTDPDLTPSAVAAGLGVSVRTLQRAFAGGPSVCDWIARFRLQHALDFLQDPQFSVLSIPQIAARSGFGSTVAMRRAVAAATGLPPAAYRESLHQSTILDSQPLLQGFTSQQRPSTPAPRSGRVTAQRS